MKNVPHFKGHMPHKISRINFN